MTTELDDEVHSINAIFDSQVLVRYSSQMISDLTSTELVLNVPNTPVKLRVNVPSAYPSLCPNIDGTETFGTDISKQDASKFAQQARDVLVSVFREGEPCFFAFIEELNGYSSAETHVPSTSDDMYSTSEAEESLPLIKNQTQCSNRFEGPEWALSDVIIEKKSVFIARATHVTDPTRAKANVEHLKANDKKVAKATHNIIAWRMKDDEAGVIYRDCDDDGEDAAGSRVLHLLEIMDAWNVMVVVTRWYGGVHLGPNRFRIVNSCARDAIVNGDLAGKSTKTASKKKKCR